MSLTCNLLACIDAIEEIMNALPPDLGIVKHFKTVAKLNVDLHRIITKTVICMPCDSE